MLGGTVQKMTFKDAGTDVDGIMHAALATPDGFGLFASDHMDGMGDYTPGTNEQVSLSGDETTKVTVTTAGKTWTSTGAYDAQGTLTVEKLPVVS